MVRNDLEDLGRLLGGQCGLGGEQAPGVCERDVEDLDRLRGRPQRRACLRRRP
jgi:hypothetical protein